MSRSRNLADLLESEIRTMVQDGCPHDNIDINSIISTNYRE